MGNSTLIQDKSLSPSATSIQEVTLKVQTMRLMMHQLNSYIHELENQPFLHCVNKIEERMVDQLLEKVKKFEENLAYLKKFLYSNEVNPSKDELIQNVENESDFVDIPFDRKTSPNLTIVQANTQQQDNQNFPQELAFLNLANQPPNNPRASTERYYSMIFKDQVSKSIIQQHQPSNYTQISPFDQETQKTYKKHTIEQLENFLSQLREQNAGLKCQIVELEEKNQQLTKRMDELWQEKHQLEIKAFQSKDQQKSIQQMVNCF